MSYIGNEPVVSATRTITEVSATAGQTTFTANGGYTVGYIDVFVNGSQLQTSDFTASNGSTVVLNTACIAGDDVRLVAWGKFNVSNLVAPNYTGGLTGDTGVVNIGSGQLYKDTSGNVGVGTTSPTNFVGYKTGTANGSTSGLFTVQANGTDSGYIYADATAFIIDSKTATPTLSFKTNGSERLRIDSSGNVGIGTSTPTDTNGFGKIVDLNGTSGAAFYARTAGSGTNVTTFGNYGTDGYISNNGAGNIRFSNAGAERMRIDASGNLLFNSGYGSVATAYGCRVWVNYDSNAQSIIGSGGVSSVTYNSGGLWTINFSVTMPDSNYAVTCGSTSYQSTDINRYVMVRGSSGTPALKSTTQVQMVQGYGSVPSNDTHPMYVTIFR